MRLQPLVPSGIQRVTPATGVTIGNQFIPGDTVCRIPDYVAWRDERNFAIPEKFMSERWTSKRDLLLRPDIFHPFGRGIYGCVGQKAAWIQMGVTLARMVVTSDWELDGVDVEAWENSGKDHFTMKLNPLPLFVSRRYR